MICSHIYMALLIVEPEILYNYPIHQYKVLFEQLSRTATIFTVDPLITWDCK